MNDKEKIIQENNTKYYIFLAAIFTLGFLMIFSYGITRPLANSILNQTYGAPGLAYAWILIAVLVGGATYTYNRLISTFSYSVVFCGIILFIAASTAIIWYLLPIKPKIISVFFYAWKDVYILILVEQLWSFCNSFFTQKRARTIYGWLMASGGIGAILANILVKEYVKSVGTRDMILFPIPCFILMIFCFIIAVHLKKQIKLSDAEEKDNRSPDEYKFDKDGGIKLVFGSRFLFALLMVVFCLQLSTAFLDFQLNTIIKETITSRDAKSAFFGEIYLYINIVSLVLQIIGVPLILKYYGLMRTHYSIPGVLFVSTLLFAIMPGLAFISIVFIAIKTLDYSLFRAAKEMLYMPFNAEIQYKAKAIIDIFGYRFVKVLTAAGILLLKQSKINPLHVINITVLMIIIIWIFMVTELKKHFQKEMDLMENEKKS